MSKKLIGKIVTDKLSGKKGIVVDKKKGRYVVRVWIAEQCSWFLMKCPKSQFEIGYTESKKLGFKN